MSAQGYRTSDVQCKLARAASIGGTGKVIQKALHGPLSSSRAPRHLPGLRIKERVDECLDIESVGIA